MCVVSMLVNFMSVQTPPFTREDTSDDDDLLNYKIRRSLVSDPIRIPTRKTPATAQSRSHEYRHKTASRRVLSNPFSIVDNDDDDDLLDCKITSLQVSDPLRIPTQKTPYTAQGTSDELFYYKSKSSGAGSHAGSRAGSLAGSSASQSSAGSHCSIR